MIYQMITVSSYLGLLSSPRWYFLIESISLVLFSALVILMLELWLTLMLLSGLIVGLLLYHFTRAAGAAFLLCAQYLHHSFKLPKFHWWINHRPAA